jgi:hypothetical protein
MWEQTTRIYTVAHEAIDKVSPSARSDIKPRNVNLCNEDGFPFVHATKIVFFFCFDESVTKHFLLPGEVLKSKVDPQMASITDGLGCDLGFDGPIGQ